MAKKLKQIEHSYQCPFCDLTFLEDRRAGVPMSEIGKDFREHLRLKHPIQHQDLRTTRWQNGKFVRCEPIKSGLRRAKTQNTPPPGHGLDTYIHVDGVPGSNSEGVLVVCKCGWQELSTDGKSLAEHMLKAHYASPRLSCPYCVWVAESVDLESAEYTMAVHIGMSHPDKFPWGYENIVESSD